MNFPKNGSRLTPSHHADTFKWKDYCPMVFRFVAWYPIIKVVNLSNFSEKNMRLYKLYENNL